MRTSCVAYDFQLTARESAVLAGMLFPPEVKVIFEQPENVVPDTFALTKAYKRLRAERLALKESELLQLARGRARDLIDTLERLEATTDKLRGRK